MKSFAGTERRYGHVQAVRCDAVYAFGEQSEIRTADRDFVDGEEWHGLPRIMIENNTFQNTTRKWEVDSMKGANLDLTVARFPQVLQHRISGERPKTTGG